MLIPTADAVQTAVRARRPLPGTQRADTGADRGHRAAPPAGHPAPTYSSPPSQVLTYLFFPFRLGVAGCEALP